MFIVLILAYISLFMAIVGAQFLSLASHSEELRSTTRNFDVMSISGELQRYFNETGEYPVSLSSLQNATGFEHLRLADNTAVSYKATTTPLTSSLFKYSRVAIVSQDVKSTLSDVELFGSTENTCDSGTDFDNAGSWCGRDVDKWWMQESKDIIPVQIYQQRTLLSKTARKFALKYSAVGSFPNPGATGSYAIKTLVGAGGTASNCVGEFTWNDIPIGCDDIYGLTGQPVSYIYGSAKHIDIAVQLDHKDALGQPIIVMFPMDLP